MTQDGPWKQGKIRPANRAHPRKSGSFGPILALGSICCLDLAQCGSPCFQGFRLYPFQRINDEATFDLWTGSPVDLATRTRLSQSRNNKIGVVLGYTAPTNPGFAGVERHTGTSWRHRPRIEGEGGNAGRDRPRLWKEQTRLGRRETFPAKG
ncbi:hypothetical protein BJX63DRAFT_350364 [Aspergillus granulosus]|uniref:Uncharacterized protein n=1 Tax=Aspergillus granulosus TaxID=176169 RepID=A0ABR4H271_9EURO